MRCESRSKLFSGRKLISFLCPRVFALGLLLARILRNTARIRERKGTEKEYWNIGERKRRTAERARMEEGDEGSKWEHYHHDRDFAFRERQFLSMRRRSLWRFFAKIWEFGKLSPRVPAKRGSYVCGSCMAHTRKDVSMLPALCIGWIFCNLTFLVSRFCSRSLWKNAWRHATTWHWQSVKAV